MAEQEDYRLRRDAPEPVDWQSSARPAEGSLFAQSRQAPVAETPRQERAADRYGVFAFGTNDWGNPKAAVDAAHQIYSNAQSMGMTPVFVLPNAAHEKFAPVSNALKSFAEERGIKYETPLYEKADPLHLTRQSAMDIAKRYPDAFVGGDSNSVRLHNWGYGRKLATKDTYVDPRTGQLLSKVGAPSKDIANYITQYRKMLERGQYKDGGYTHPSGVKFMRMAPHEYLARGGALKMNERDRRLIKKYEDHFKSGGQVEPAVIGPNGKLKGRHRATAAKNLGHETIPVAILPQRGKAAFGGSYGSPQYAAAYEAFGHIPLFGNFFQRLMPMPFKTESNYTPQESTVKTPEFDFKPTQPAQGAPLANLDYVTGNQSSDTSDSAGASDQMPMAQQVPQSESLQAWKNLAPEKRGGGTVVKQALMVVSKQANRRRGRPD